MQPSHENRKAQELSRPNRPAGQRPQATRQTSTRAPHAKKKPSATRILGASYQLHVFGTWYQYTIERGTDAHKQELRAEPNLQLLFIQHLHLVTLCYIPQALLVPRT